MSAPFAIQCPWPRWVLVMRSVTRSAAHTPTATASSPTYGCTAPWIRPCVRSSMTRRSNSRIRIIVRSMSTSCAFGGSTLFTSACAHSVDHGRGKGRTRMTSLSRQLARWVVGLRYEDLPAAVVDRAKGVTLHGLASILLGAQSRDGQQAVTMIVEEEAGVPTGATIMVDGTKVTKGGAAFANAEMAMSGGKWDT